MASGHAIHSSNKLVSAFLLRTARQRATCKPKIYRGRGGVKQEGFTDNNGYAHIDAKDGDSMELNLIFEAPTGPLKHRGK